MSVPFYKHPIIVLTAPSGAGKTTIAHRLMEAVPELCFSVSATTRPPRPNEKEGVDYFFLSEAEFRDRIERGDFIEHEEVYPGRLYGTLRPEIELKAQTCPVLLDIDVKGAVNVEKIFTDQALTIFIRPPSFDALRERLRARKTETEDTLAQRLERSKAEMAMEGEFDVVVVNDVLDEAVDQTVRVVREHIWQYHQAKASQPD